MKKSVLLIEDDVGIAEVVRDVIESEGFVFYHASRGEKGLADAQEKLPALILLDLNLPDLNGTEICRKLKDHARTKKIPIIFLSGKGHDTDVVLGLGLGADDYVRKPFSSHELVARVHAVLRRVPQSQPPTEAISSLNEIRHGAISMDRARFEVRANGQLTPLTLVEFEILWVLTERPGNVFSREQLLDKLNQGDSVVIDRTIDVHIGAIRKKLGTYGNAILTVRGLGYKVAD